MRRYDHAPFGRHRPQRLSTIEEGATIRSLSLVRGTLTAWTINAGTPARKVRDRDRDGVLDAERRFRASC